MAHTDHHGGSKHTDRHIGGERVAGVMHTRARRHHKLPGKRQHIHTSIVEAEHNYMTVEHIPAFLARPSMTDCY